MRVCDAMAHYDGWLRRTVHLILIISLSLQFHTFVLMVLEKDVGVLMSSAWDDRVKYPSVTICPQPGPEEDHFGGNLLSVTSRDWLTYFRHNVYLENG